MKKTITCLSIVMCCSSLMSQNYQKCVYLVGSLEVPGYKIKTQECVIKVNDGEIVHAPVMAYFEQKKQDYIGGTIEDSNGKTTIIKNISTMVEKDVDGNNVTTLIVEGKDFTMKVSTLGGEMLSHDDTQTIFYSKDTGIWKIFKKKK